MKHLVSIPLFIAMVIIYLLFIDQQDYKAKSYDQEMILIPSTKFLMGSDDPDSYSDERPVHVVYVDSFLIDKYEVTNLEFSRFVDETGYLTTAERMINWEEMRKQLDPNTSRPPDSLLGPGSMIFMPTEYPIPLTDESRWWKWENGVSWKNPYGNGSSINEIMSHPVVHISWDDAVAYSIWAKKRLPTEAEWELASRGGRAEQRYPWGNESINKGIMRANFWQGHFPYENTLQDGYSTTSPVGSFEPNDYGIYDMAGNVWEWCSDYYSENTYLVDKSRGEVKNPKGSKKKIIEGKNYFRQMRVLRGGSFLCNDSYCSGYRVSRRMSSSQDSGLSHTGFRCVRDI